MKKMKQLVSLALALVLACSLLLVPTAAVSLSDIDGSWAKDVILYGVEKGYISGYNDGTFRPNAPVTRAQFAKMLNNALGVKNSEQSQFIDVASSAWYYDEVCKAVSVQYVSGYTDGTFRPEATITRQEAAAMMSRVVTAPTEQKSSAEFADAARIDAWATSSIDFVYSKGYMKGDTQNRFDPQGKLTRAQAAQMIYSVVEGETIANEANEAIAIDRENVLFVNNATASATNAVALKNCRVLGTLSIGSTDVTLDSTQANAMSVVGEDVTVTASGATLVKKTALRAGASLQEKNLTGEGYKDVALTGDLSTATVRLAGSFDTVSVETGTVLSQTNGKIAKLDVAKKANVTFQRGTVDAMEVAPDAAGSAMILSADVTVANATINAAASFLGAGKISSATVNAAGCSFETQPDHITNNANDTSAAAMTPTVVPANGTQNVPKETQISLVFPEQIYTLDRQIPTLQYLRGGVLTIRENNSTAIEYNAVISGNTITVTPTAPLTVGRSYYVSIASNKLMNAEGKQNSAFSSYFTVSNAATSMTPTIKPENGAKDVSIGTAVTLTFENVLFTATGTALTNSYIESNVAEIHAGTETGNRVSYTASISADRKTITLTPDSALSLDAPHYVVLKDRSLRNEAGVYNTKLVSVFTTGSKSTLQPQTVTPVNNALNVYPSTQIALTFSERVYRAVGDPVDSKYIRENVVELRKDSATGNLVDCTATVSADARTITLKPNVNLAANTTYYIIVKAGTLVTADGAANSGYISVFSTGTTINSDIVFFPANNETNVPISGPFTITFPQAVNSAGYTTATLKPESAIKLYANPNGYGYNYNYNYQYSTVTGTEVSFTATASADKKTITITPTDDLAYGTRYAIAILKDSLTYSDGTYVGALASYFTTAANNPITITESNVGSTTATVTITTSEDCAVTMSYVSGGISKQFFQGLDFTKNVAQTFNLTGLTAGYTTTVTASTVINNYTYQNSRSFTTTAASKSTQLEAVKLTVGSRTYSASLTTTGYWYNATYQIPALTVLAATGTALRVKPTEATVASIEYATGVNPATYTALTLGADGYYSAAIADFAAGTTTQLYIRVTAQDGTIQNYVMSVTSN